MTAHEPEVVRREQLKVILDRLIKQHNADRPPRAVSGQIGSQITTTPFTSGRLWICHATGISERLLYRICSEEVVDYVVLSTADKIMTGLELEHLLGSDQLPVIPNPKLSEAQYRKSMTRRGVEL